MGVIGFLSGYIGTKTTQAAIAGGCLAVSWGLAAVSVLCPVYAPITAPLATAAFEAAEVTAAFMINPVDPTAIIAGETVAVATGPV